MWSVGQRLGVKVEDHINNFQLTTIIRDNTLQKEKNKRNDLTLESCVKKRRFHCIQTACAVVNVIVCNVIREICIKDVHV